MSKLSFYREDMGELVPVESDYIDNFIYTSKEFTRYLHVNGQVISHIVVEGRHHNGLAKNEIKNVVRIDRTMMIHYALRWIDASDESLWEMDMAHAVHSHNHNPHISSGMSPEEAWSGSKFSHSAYIIITHGDALHISWNQNFRMENICLSVCQGIGELNIWEILLCIPAQWACPGTYKMATSDLNLIWFLMTILRLCMHESIKNLHFCHN